MRKLKSKQCVVAYRSKCRSLIYIKVVITDFSPFDCNNLELCNTGNLNHFIWLSTFDGINKYGGLELTG